MDPIETLTRFYDCHSKTFEILVTHGKQVADKAIKAAEKVAHLDLNLDFIQNSAKPVDHIIQTLMPYGQDKVDRFQKWVALFGA